MRLTKLAPALLALASCAIYPPERDLTQPNKIKKSGLVCGDSKLTWEQCRKQLPADWYFRATTIDAPYEAWWTFVGEQGNTYRINWVVTEDALVAYRTYETWKGGDGEKGRQPGALGEPIAQWPIQGHFDVRNQYNSATGEELPVIVEQQEGPWQEREYIRVDWANNQISGYGFFMGSKLQTILDGQGLKVEPATYAVTDPNDPDYRIVSDDYVDVVTRETHTPMTVNGMGGEYFSGSPIAQVSYRYSFMKVAPTDYQPFFYPDPAFEKFGYFRLERETYDRERGPTDFRDLLMERWNLWRKVHSDKACKAHKDCGGDAADGVTCDVFEPDQKGEGRCTLPYAERSKAGLKPIVYHLSPEFPARYLRDACVTIQGWNINLKTTMAALLNKSYTAPVIDDQFRATCRLEDFKEAPAGVEFDPAVHDLFVLKQNRKSCDENGVESAKGDRWCVRAGDLRHSMLYWVDQASSGSPLGYGPVAADPVTGEIFQGNAFIYGAAIDSYKSYVGDVYDLITNTVTDDQLRSGENVREYYQNLSGNAFPPTFPQNGFRVADLEQLQGLKEELKGKVERAEDLKRLGPSARTPFAAKLRGTVMERMLVDHVEWKVSHGFAPDHELSDEEVEAISPFGSEYRVRQQREKALEELFSHSHNCVYRSNEYTDATVSFMAQRYVDKGFGREEAVNAIMADVFRGVTEHELGHNMGLRHNFEASFDSDNYFPRYYELLQDAALKMPDPKDFGFVPDNPSTQVNEQRAMTPEQYAAYDAQVQKVRRDRDAAGVKLEQYSSIMDYGGQFYSDFRGLGSYDLAAIKFGYGRLVEVFDGDPNADRTNRLNRHWYLGGESCTANEECPSAAAGQTCLPATASGKRFCSAWDKDAAANANENKVVKYRFCSDERVQDRPFCNRFDEGSSSSEIVENLADSYDRNYIFNNFRRYRRWFGPSYASRIWSRYFEMMGKQFASLLYQLYYNPTASLTDGPGSVSDMLGASVKAMNFYTRVLTQPDVGGYDKRELDVVDGTQRYIYERTTSDCTDASADLPVCLGVGKHFYSVWEQGYYGALDRQARAGTYTDKILALQALTQREWGNPQANDETYPLSFYDGFQSDMLSLFSGLISQDIGRYAPTVKPGPAGGKPFVQFRDVWSGSFFGTDSTNFMRLVKYPGRAELDDRYAKSDLLDPEGRSPYIRFIALYFSLGFWPSVYDMTYADYLQLYQFGGPEVRFPADGRETVSYESPRRKKIYMAVQTPDKKSIIFPLVKQAADLKAQYDFYEGLRGTALDAKWPDMQRDYPRECNTQVAPNAAACQARIVDSIGNTLDDRESFLNITYNVREALGLAGL